MSSVSTPQQTVDVVVTDAGIAVNPEREDLVRAAKGSVELVDIDILYEKARRLVGEPKKPDLTDDVIAIVEYRDGTVLDTVKKVKR